MFTRSRGGHGEYPEKQCIFSAISASPRETVFLISLIALELVPEVLAGKPREAVIAYFILELLPVVPVVREMYLALYFAGERTQLIKRRVNAAREELTIVEDRLKRKLFVICFDKIPVEAGIARKHDAAVYDKAAAPERALPVGR